MNKIRQLQIILLDSLDSLRALQATNQALPTALQHCIKKGRVQRLWNHDDESTSLAAWQKSMLHALPAELLPSGMASAALCWRGEGGVLRPGTWMKLQLAHYAAGMNDVHIRFPNDVSDDQGQELINAVRPLLTLAGFETHSSPGNQWYVWCEPVLDLKTPEIHSGITTNRYDVLPSGVDAPPLRRLLTEAQMTLHQHPINHQREQQGLPTLNGIWLSGAGSPVAASSSTSQRIMSTQPYVIGLCEQINSSCLPVPSGIDELLQLRDDQMVLVLSGADVLAVDRDWMQPVLSSLNAGYIAQLEIYLDHLKFSMQGGRLHQVHRWLSRDNEIVELLN